VTELERRLSDAFHRNLDQLPAPPPDSDRLRRARRTGVFVAGSLVVMGLLVAGGAAVVTAELLGGVRREAPGVPGVKAADVAVIECREDGVRVLTPRVRASDDGVHIRIVNTAGKREFFMVDTDESEDNEGGRLKSKEDTQLRSFTPPGGKAFGCLDTSDEIDFDGNDPSYGRFTVIDPKGLWIPGDLACNGSVDKARIAVSGPLRVTDDLEAVARDYVSGIRPADVLERPGYPKHEWHIEPRTVVREGRRIAGLRFAPGERSGTIFLDACSDSGIGASQSENRETADLYQRIAHKPGLSVFGPSGQPWGWCPIDAEPLTGADLDQTEEAVVLAASTISDGLNTEGAFADAKLAADHTGAPDFSTMIETECGTEMVDHTAVVTLRLPQVKSASMSAETYFVTKEPRGWVIWNSW
jgi:hypothetical protein